MKRLVVAAAAAVVLVLLVAGAASADGGPHGGYTPTSDACAGCHRAHTAVAPMLLVATESDLCFTCHGITGSGAETNVLDGIYMNRMTPPGTDGTLNQGLKGGGFENAKMSTDLATAGTSLATTSKHLYNGTAGTVWGNGAAGSGVGGSIELSCANCHDPHGNGNYRILRPRPRDSSATVDVNVTDEATKNYTVADANNQYWLEGHSGRFGITTEYEQLSGWCAQCHTRYMAGPGSATNPLAGDADFTYRHSTDGSGGCGKCHNGSPSAATVFVTFGDDFSHDVQCMTCHVAHGTSASMAGDGFTTYSQNVEWPDDPITPVDPAANSRLLRVDNRGTCQSCHGK